MTKTKFNSGDKVRCIAVDEHDLFTLEVGKVYTVYRTAIGFVGINERAIGLKETKGLFWERCFELVEDDSGPILCRKCKKGTHHVHQLVTKYQGADMFLGVELCCKCFFEAEKVLQEWLKDETGGKEE